MKGTIYYFCRVIAIRIGMDAKAIYLKDAVDFLESMPEKAQRKMYYNIDLICGGVKDEKLFKKLEGTEIWEVRTLYSGIAYRLLSFWDTEEDTLIVASNGFVKKTKKTPKKEIEKAENIRIEYFNNK